MLQFVASKHVRSHIMLYNPNVARSIAKFPLSCKGLLFFCGNNKLHVSAYLVYGIRVE